MQSNQLQKLAASLKALWCRSCDQRPTAKELTDMLGNSVDRRNQTDCGASASKIQKFVNEITVTSEDLNEEHQRAGHEITHDGDDNDADLSTENMHTVFKNHLLRT